MLAGRYTGTIEGDFVVFLIGMRVNKPWKVHRWRRFNRLVRGSGDVGIWHEAYRVRAGEYETIYGNMPRIGLGRFGDHRALGSTSTAAVRSGIRADDKAPVPVS